MSANIDKILQSKILVVEDDESLNRLISKILNDAGYLTSSVYSAQDAVNFYIENQDYLLLLDYNLPDFSGLEVIKKIKITCDVNFLVITGCGDENIAIEMMKLGALDYIIKSSYFIELLPSVVDNVFKQIKVKLIYNETQIKLKQSEDKFKSIFNNSGIGILIIGLNGKIIDCNPTLLGILGYNSEEMQSQSIYKFIFKEDLNPNIDWIHADEEYYSYLHGYNSEKRFLSKEGKIVWCKITGSYVFDNNEKPLYAIGLIEDISERKYNENIIKLNETRLEVLLKLNQMSNASIQQIANFALDEAIKLTSSKIGYLAFVEDDQQTINMFSWSEEAMKQCEIKNITWEYKLEKMGLWGEALRQKKPIITNNYSKDNQYKRGYPEGHVNIKRHLNIPVFEADKVVAIAGVGNKEDEYDASDVKQLTLLMNGMWRLIQKIKSEEELKKSEERYRLIADNSNDIIVNLSKYGEVIYISPVCELILGWEPKEIVGKSVLDYFHPEDIEKIEKYFNLYVKHLENNPIIKHKLLRHRIKKKDNSYIWAESNNQFIIDENNKLIQIVSVTRDISEKIKSEELIKQKEAAEYANKAKSEFIANLSHEIRNPINAIIGMTELLSKTNLNTQQQKYINSVKISSNNLLNVINEVLDFSKIEAQKIVINNNNFKISNLLDDIYAIFEGQAELKNISFRTVIRNNLTDNFYGDSGKLKQILINLVSNAIKFTEKGKVELKAELISQENQLKVIKFTISDTGIGIKQENFPNVFQSFTQFEISTNKTYSGTGLGLSIVKNFTEILGGNVNFESVYGKGTKFYVVIPLNIAEQQNNKKIKSKELKVIDKENNKKYSILIVEDDLINQLYLKNIITLNGYKTDTASDGHQAIEKYMSENFDIILMDGQMPKMNGFDATIRIREIDKHLNKKPQIIAITGYAISGDRDKFLDIGMDDYITKPINEKQLLDIIDKHLNKKYN